MKRPCIMYTANQEFLCPQSQLGPTIWILFTPPLFVYPGWNEVCKGMSRRTEVAPAVALRRLLNGPASRGGRKIWRRRRRREPAGSVCHRRSCYTSSSTCLSWIGLTLLRYWCDNEPSVIAQEAVLSFVIFIYWSFLKLQYLSVSAWNNKADWKMNRQFSLLFYLAHVLSRLGL